METKRTILKNFICSSWLAWGLLCLLPASVDAQTTVKERAALNRHRPALWFLSKNKEKYMHYQPDTTEQKKVVKVKKTKKPKDYNVYKGEFNLLINNNTYDYHWTYVPQSGTYEETSAAILFGIGVGFEYAYRDNRMVSLEWTGGGAFDGLGYGGVTDMDNTVHQIDLLHSWNLWRFTLSAGPTLAWKRWSYWIDEHYFFYEYSPELDDYVYVPNDQVPAPWDKEFEFRHWSAGLKTKVHFHLDPMFSIGVEYAVRRAWEKPFRHDFDHQLTVKCQIRFALFGKK